MTPYPRSRRSALVKIRLMLLAALIVALAAPTGAWAQAPKPAEPEKGSSRVKQTAEITMDKGGVIKIEFFPEDAPKTVENFVTLAKKGFYDGLTFHRVAPGFVVDGSGAPGVAADVALEGDRIAAVGPALTGQTARTIDAKGLMVAPGFIDIHSHSDLVYQTCPSAESKVRQGVTTEVVGMCGFSPGPIGQGREDEVRDWIGGIGSKPRVSWHSFGEYLDSVRGLGVSVNVVQFVGHGALRWAAM